MIVGMDNAPLLNAHGDGKAPLTPHCMHLRTAGCAADLHGCQEAAEETGARGGGEPGLMKDLRIWRRALMVVAFTTRLCVPWH